MYARVISFKCDPSKLDEAAEKIVLIKEQAETVVGLLSVSSVWRANGDGITMAIYESRAHADAAAPQIQAAFSIAATILIEPPHIEEYENVANVKS